MPVSDHPEYAIEAVYLQRTLRAVERQIELLENLGWSGGGNPRATVVIGERFNQQAAHVRGMAA